MKTRAWFARLWRLASELLVVTVIIPATLAGQSVDVVIAGVVVDQTGAVVQGATITATNVATGVVRLATSDSTGQYRVAPLAAGVYNLKAELVGFRPQLRTGQILHVGTVVTIDFTFDEVAAAAAIEVIGDAPVLETTKNTLSRLIDKAEIDGLPVVDRNFNALASLTPGVTATGIYGGVDISGSRDFQNGYNVDGVSAEGLGVGDQRVAYAQDWIQEFQVLTTQYSPEFGRASGGIVNAITRSGSNMTTGRAYGFFRNEAWDAKPVFATSKTPLQLKRLGGTTGGKLITDRLFFFGGAEWFDNQTSSVVNSSFAERNGTVPTTSNQKLFIAKIPPTRRRIVFAITQTDAPIRTWASAECQPKSTGCLPAIRQTMLSAHGLRQSADWRSTSCAAHSTTRLPTPAATSSIATRRLLDSRLCTPAHVSAAMAMAMDVGPWTKCSSSTTFPGPTADTI
jgi:carboxypeptidase family protein